uniref:Uncharacterized protein n=1 Tax=Rhizophagus irregularis (strain DAOM 181602 / DAOM 197198 / MUCL 43194) TaxID=747089 RepID=U9STR9_RHIID
MSNFWNALTAGSLGYHYEELSEKVKDPKNRGSASLAYFETYCLGYETHQPEKLCYASEDGSKFLDFLIRQEKQTIKFYRDIDIDDEILQTLPESGSIAEKLPQFTKKNRTMKMRTKMMKTFSTHKHYPPDLMKTG